MNTEVASSSQETKEHEHTFRATQLVRSCRASCAAEQSLHNFFAVAGASVELQAVHASLQASAQDALV